MLNIIHKKNKWLAKTAGVFLLSFFVIASFAQKGDKPLTTRSNKARKAFEESTFFYTAKKYPEAEEELRKAIHADENFIEAYLLLGDILADEHKTAESIQAYKKAIGIDAAFFPNAYFICASLELSIGRYQEAKDHFLTFSQLPDIPSEKSNKVRKAIQTCDFALNAIAHPVAFNPQNLGDSINTTDDEYANSITADDQFLFFTRKQLKENQATGKTHYEEDFFMSRSLGSKWLQARALGPPINTSGDEGAFFISPDGMDLFFAAGYRQDGLGRFDIYTAHREGGGWNVPYNIGPPVNTASWESQPSISSDGKTLYFASLRNGGFGNSDIWKSVRQPDGSWSIPVNLGENINTATFEMNPYIHPDGRTLYFSSMGHMGMGGYDLFYSRLDSSGNWSKPVNLGFPINTYADEINLIVNARGNLAYFSSDKLGGFGKNDIYCFDLYPDARPILVNYMKGRVFDSKTKLPLEAKFELKDLKTGAVVVTSFSEKETGGFLVALPSGKEYALHVSKEAYLFYSENVSFTGDYSAEKPLLKDVPLQPVAMGEIVVMNNIFFETGKADLKPESMVELEKLLDLMRKNPGLSIEIRGHTDNVGADELNMKLSENRAQVVYNYLINNGIHASRLTFKGFGKTIPVASNDTAEGRSLNRRTEFKVVEK